jgi:hypothetical protein
MRWNFAKVISAGPNLNTVRNETTEQDEGLKYVTLSSRDKTQHLTPRATESGYEHNQTKILARTVARCFHGTDLYEDDGDQEFWRRGGT